VLLCATSGSRGLGLAAVIAHEGLGIVGRVPEAHFEHPRLVAIYDELHGDRRDLDLYIAMAGDIGARRVLDLGCGTGTLALRLVERGVEVVAVDPAAGSLRVAQTKAGADRICWIHGDATALPPMQADLATMTANVAQAIVDPADWDRTLRGVHGALRPGGRLVFETRDPADRAWERWNRAATHRSVELAGVGAVENWTDLVEVDGPLVSFRQTYVFARDGAALTSASTLRFRERDEVVAALLEHGYVVEDVLDAPDRQIGREMVFVARHPS
jgi:SAM-dependent methyltransferase